MSQVVLVARDEKLAELLKESALSVKVLAPTDFGRLARQAKIPSVVVMDLRGSEQLPADLVTLRRNHPDVRVVIIISTLEPQLMLEAMRVGCNECLTEPLSALSIEQAVRKLLAEVAPKSSSDVLAFVGAKGGVGTTTLAVNTAVALQRTMAGGVLLMDTHIVFGEAALFFGAEPRFSILDAFENTDHMDESFFGSLLETTKSGVRLLASSTQAHQRPVDGRHVRALFEIAALTHKVTVLDVPRVDSTILNSLDLATAIVVVTEQEIASLRNAAQMTETLRKRYGTAKVRVVVNRFSSNKVVELDDIERTIGSHVAHVVPSDYPVALEALNTGRPIVLGGGRLAEAVRKMATGLVVHSSERQLAPPPGSVLGHLA